MKNLNVTEFTSFITPYGDEYNFDTTDRFIISEEGFGMPPIEYITQKGPFQHGASLLDYRISPRTIQIILRQNSCGRSNYWGKRSDLINAVRPNAHLVNEFRAGTLRKSFPDGSKRDLDVVIEQGPIFKARDISVWDEWGFTETLRFIAHDPIFYDPEYYSMEISDIIDEEHLIFPITFPIIFGAMLGVGNGTIDYPGSWETFPFIRVIGPSIGFKITHQETEQVIESNYVIPEDDEVHISLPPGNKTVTNSFGHNLIGTITKESNLETFSILPHPLVENGTNTFQFLASGASYQTKLLIQYKIRYLGI